MLHAALSGFLRGLGYAYTFTSEPPSPSPELAEFEISETAAIPSTFCACRAIRATRIDCSAARSTEIAVLMLLMCMAPSFSEFVNPANCHW
jgi:hypothetical protein